MEARQARGLAPDAEAQELALVHFSAQHKHCFRDTLGGFSELGDKNGSGLSCEGVRPCRRTRGRRAGCASMPPPAAKALYLSAFRFGVCTFGGQMWWFQESIIQ